MSIVLQIHFFNKLRRKLGLRDAINTYYNLRLKKSGRIKLSFLKHAFQIRMGNQADMETFNEVLLRRAYNIQTGFTPDTIIDAGANIGLTSIFYASKYPAAKIIAIEPAPHNFELLKQNTSQYSNVSCIQAALWHEPTQLSLTDPGRGDNSLRVAAEHTTKDTLGITIQDICKKHNIEKIDILKIDIEGAEKELFSKGYENWLPNTRLIIIEIHDKIDSDISGIVQNAIDKYNFTKTVKGANTVYVNNDLVKPS